MNADIKDIAVLIDQLDDLLLHAVHIHLSQTFVNADTMVDMYHIITGLQVVNLLQREGLAPFVAVADDEPMVAFKNLMVGIDTQLAVLVTKAFVQHERHRGIEVGGGIIRLVLGIVDLQQIAHQMLHAGALLLVFCQKNSSVADGYGQRFG